MNGWGMKMNYTAADAMIDSLQEAGVSCIFANLGSDHPAIIESWAKSKISGKQIPKVIICPHEAVALSAAHGHALISGKAQMVLLHVDVGTQNLGGTIHNAFRGRIPAFIFAGASPYTMESELRGSRNEYIHFYQDHIDQRGLVRANTKWDYELRTGKNVQQITYRALQMAESDPKGPVYLMAAREVLEEETTKLTLRKKDGWGTISSMALPHQEVSELANALLEAENPLIVTTSLGRDEKAVFELIRLSETLAIPVVEAGPYYVNFPASHPMHLGYQRNEFISECDFILVIDSDVPWIPMKSKPTSTCKVYYIDIDPLKEQIPLWYIPSQKFLRSNSLTALEQINDYISSKSPRRQRIYKRRKRVNVKHIEQREQWRQAEILGSSKEITPEWLTSCIREIIDENTIILNETVTNVGAVWKHLKLDRTNQLYGSGGSSLGWNGGAALGVKLAAPDKTVVSLTGDGSYQFSEPAVVQWISHRYKLPFLTIIYNNQGWKAPKMSTLGVHPQGYAHKQNTFWVDFGHVSDLAKIAEAAGGAYAKTVKSPEQLKDTLREGLDEVKKGRSAVINVILKAISLKK
jgi:acetolactate synthase-1/2/3 large subunit